MNKKVINTILKKCLGLKQREHLAIICDDKSEELAGHFYKTAKNKASEVTLLKIAPRKMHGEEPPKEIACALAETDVAILLTSMSLSHTQARKQATAVSGTRIASLPGVTAQILNRSIDIDYSALKRRSARLAGLLSKGKRLEVYTNRGTCLSMSIDNRRGFTDNGLYTTPGAFGNLPAGEACVAPREGTCEGVLVVDGSAPLVGKLKKPIKLIIKKGRLQNMPLAKISSLIKPLGKSALNIAELGFGLNPKARVTGNTLEDEKTQGTAHLAIGANISFGGKIACQSHLDFVFLDPITYIDGKRLYY